MPAEFETVAQTRNGEGRERKVGFEFEFAGLTTSQAARLVQELFGGRIEEQNHFYAKILGTRLGDFSADLDLQTIKSEAYLKFLESIGVEIGDPGRRGWWERLIESMADFAVPHEISSPPVALSAMGEMEELRKSLRAASALGTKARLQFAFGLHLNPEMPARDAATALAYLQSFLICYPWLLEKLKVDFVRRVSPFIRPFPEEYGDLILGPGYRPSLEQLAGDYLEFNPTRNRPLDMLPVLADLYPPVLEKEFADRKLVKARPAFHYRMPDCLLDDSEWTVAREWNAWVRVENLAADPEKVREMAVELLALKKRSGATWQKEWAKRCRKDFG